MSTKCRLNSNLTNWKAISLCYCINWWERWEHQSHTVFFSLFHLCCIFLLQSTAARWFERVHNLCMKNISVFATPLLVLCMLWTVLWWIQLYSKVNSPVYPWPNYFHSPHSQISAISYAVYLQFRSTNVKYPHPSPRIERTSEVSFCSSCIIMWQMYGELCEAKWKWECCNSTHVLYILFCNEFWASPPSFRNLSHDSRENI